MRETDAPILSFSCFFSVCQCRWVVCVRVPLDSSGLPHAGPVWHGTWNSKRSNLPGLRVLSNSNSTAGIDIYILANILNEGDLDRKIMSKVKLYFRNNLLITNKLLFLNMCLNICEQYIYILKLPLLLCFHKIIIEIFLK